MAFKSITIHATVAAPASKVWSYWTEPKHITQWNFASDDWCCPSAQNDLRTGGTYTARMEAKDGSFGFDFEGIYDDVVPGKLIAMTMGDGRTTRTSFESQGNTTLVTTTFDAETENSLDMQREGWQAILNNFKAYAERA